MVSPNSDEYGKNRYILQSSDGDPDRHQNLTSCSLAHCQPSLKIACKSVRKFLCSCWQIVNRETNNNENISSAAEVINLLERWNPWPHVANRHVSISQLLSLWRRSHYDVSRSPTASVVIITSFSLWRHSLLSWPRPPFSTDVRTPYRV